MIINQALSTVDVKRTFNNYVAWTSPTDGCTITILLHLHKNLMKYNFIMFYPFWLVYLFFFFLVHLSDFLYNIYFLSLS